MQQRSWFHSLLRYFLFLALVLACQPTKLAVSSKGRVPTAEPLGKIEPSVLEELRSQGQVTFWVLMSEQADTSFAESISDWEARGQVVFDTLVEVARRTQKPVLDILATAGAEAESFWIVNTIKVITSGEQLIKGLAERSDVASIKANASWRIPEPLPGSAAPSAQAVEWGLARVRAPEVWQRFNVRGEGMVVGTIDTGVQFDHPALVMQYRGRRPDGTFDHNYNWYDPSHICNSSPAPCDNIGHGTHTMGIIVGDDRGPNRIGVAPRAQWIAAKGCESNACSYSALLSSGQWMLAPTDLNGQNPQPSLRPHVVSNSWGSETTNDPFYRTIVQTWRNAGIFPVFASGNDRRGTPNCGSVEAPAAYLESFAVGATDSNDDLAGMSKLGPATAFGNVVKPNVSAPGVNIRSSLPAGRYDFNSGTSTATPHVAGVVALIWSASPALVGGVAHTFDLLQTTARAHSSTRCNPAESPNNAYGWGIVDALAAVRKARQGELSFIDRTDFAVGSAPSSIAEADFNGDAIPDLVVTHWPNTVSVLLGKGNGVFGPPQEFAVGRGPTSVAVGDFNGDKIQDLVVTNGGTITGHPPVPGTTVSILLGKGDGTFGPAQNFAIGRNPRSVVVGDFNGDKIQDLAVANAASNDVSILLGNGDGTFGPARNLTVGRSPTSVAVADFNNDKVPDLAVANVDSDHLSILLGNGDGTFGSAHSFVVGSGSRSLAVGDFNGDKIPDLAVYATTVESTRTVPVVAILLGNGDGTFRSAQPLRFEFSSYPTSITVADFNGDTVPDLAVTTWGSDVLILLGNGDGTFRSTKYFGVGARPVSITVGDFNDDKILDLAVANQDAASASILIGQGDGTFRSSTNLLVEPVPRAVSVGDFNGDRLSDLAVLSARGLPYPGRVSILLGNQDGSFQPARNFEVGLLPISLAVGDFNGDKILDLAAANGGIPADPGSTVSILLGNRDGSFGPAQDFGVGNAPSSVAVGDFNGDKIPDLVTANLWSNNISILLGTGDGTFGPAQSFAVGDAPSSVAVADFNGDKIQDLAVANEHSNDVSVLLGNGDGTFQAAQSFAVGRERYSARQPRSIAVGDFNGDKILDLATGNVSSGNVSILLGNGDGTFRSAQNFYAGGGPTFVSVGDFNSDNLQDLVVVNGSSGNVSILINETP